MSPLPEPSNADRYQRLAEKFAAELEERRAIERELAHLASFAELDPNIILETDAENHVVYQNIVAVEQFGELNGQKDHPLLAGLPEIFKTMQREQELHFNREVKVGDRIFDQHITLIENGSRLRSYFSDVTELKRLDQLKTDFVNMASHELRSPLTSLQAMVRLVHDELLGPLNADQKKSLAVAVGSISRLNRLIDDLLDISKIEEGKMELNLRPTAMQELLQEMKRHFDPLTQQRGLSLQLQAPAEPLMAVVDHDKLIQVLTNLIQNAIKFTPQGGITLTAQAEAKAIIITVADTGPGISPDDLPKLFGKFQQIATRAADGEKGSGLGLAICKAIVERHGGRIWAESTLGQGTQIHFTLPVP